MTIKNLIDKLTKMNISYTVLDLNGYNKDVCFSINSMSFKAGFCDGKEIIQDFCREICYDNCNQEMERRFFDNFSQLLRYANR